MSPEVLTLITVGIFVLLLILGAEIFVSIIITSAISLLFFIGQPVTQLAYTAFDVVNSFTLTCLPLFIFMGALFGTTGIVEDLIYGVDKLTRRLPGGVAASVIVTNAVFGAMSGSQLAASAMFGKTCFGPMEKLGYDPKLALGSIAVGGTIAGVIPPSFVFIIYGVWMNVSVARLFAAGLIPGIILTTLLLILIAVRVTINPSLAPKSPESTTREKLIALRKILPFAGVILLVLGTIFAGVMTPTESAALGAFISIILAFIYRKMSWAAFKGAMRSALTITAMVLFIMFAARVLSVVFNYLGATEGVSAFFAGVPFGKYGVLAIICVIYIIMGMFIDATSMLVLTLPFISPLVAAMGFDYIWFGVMFAIIACIGLVTPPFGLTLFVVKGVIPKYDVMTVARGSAPFLIPLFLMLVILAAFPELALWLPHLLYR
ncbi:Sialic acid TRAP transporter permease protein SiaT [subsurface metagenome]